MPDCRAEFFVDFLQKTMPLLFPDEMASALPNGSINDDGSLVLGASVCTNGVASSAAFEWNDIDLLSVKRVSDLISALDEECYLKEFVHFFYNGYVWGFLPRFQDGKHVSQVGFVWFISPSVARVLDKNSIPTFIKWQIMWFFFFILENMHILFKEGSEDHGYFELINSIIWELLNEGIKGFDEAEMLVMTPPVVEVILELLLEIFFNGFFPVELG